MRLDRARRLLSDAATPLSAIAAELGFTGVPHLNRAFMATTDRPAQDFRGRG
ncbi:helix-turn-helix domain-containing protein [Paracoccus sanguinis]|uniref:helix-turn-helix domain-containing protein n=1 Tax=Paracoccus sanguinis TaxID=1545044 RepID=UPI0039E17D6E